MPGLAVPRVPVCLLARILLPDSEVGVCMLASVSVCSLEDDVKVAVELLALGRGIERDAALEPPQDLGGLDSGRSACGVSHTGGSLTQRHGRVRECVL